MAKGFNLCAVNFKDVATGDVGVNLPDLFPGLGSGTQVAGITYGTGLDNADYLMTSKGGTEYNKYILYVNSGSKGDHSKDYKWVDVSTSAAVTDQVKIKNGDAFWFQKYADGDLALTVSGEVELSASKSVTINGGFNLIGSFFPAGFNPNAAPYDSDYWKTAGAKAGTGLDNADYIMVSKGGTDYNKYIFYVNSGSKGDHSKDYKWVDVSTSTVVDKNIVNPGQGFWYQHYGDTMALEIKRQF